MIGCVVVGGGPAGLATSAALAERGVDHLVVERGRAGQTWRTQRWDSFRLNSPGWVNGVLGEQAPDAHAPAGEVVARLEARASVLPIREGVDVTRIDRADDGFTLRTSAGNVAARTVVVAVGHENVPRIPAVAAALPGGIVQVHAAGYRRPQALPDGGVLVVGSAQSGCQITEELLAAGRRVVLATSAVARLPIGYRGQDILRLAIEAGYFDQHPAEVLDPAELRAAQPILGSGGRGLSLQALARAGATLAGRLVAIDGNRARFDGSVAANIAAGDAFADHVRLLLDQVIAALDLPAAAPGPDPVLDGAVDLAPPVALNLREIGSIVWCTGVAGDFTCLDPALLGADGQPRHDGCAGTVPDVWYVGLHWLTRRWSSTFYGIAKDAATVAAAVQERLRGPRRARPGPTARPAAPATALSGTPRRTP